MLRRKKPIKGLPLRERGACCPRCGKQASGTPKVWHGVAVTEGVRGRVRYRIFAKFRVYSVIVKMADFFQSLIIKFDERLEFYVRLM